VQNLSDFLRYVRDKLGYTQQELADYLEITRGAYSRYELEMTIPSAEIFLKISKISNISLSWLISGEGSADEATATAGTITDDFVLLPLYDVKAAAGHGCTNYTEHVEKHLAFRKDFLTQHLHSAPNDLFLLRVHGDSMMPSIMHNDIILCDKGRKTCRQDGIYIIRMDNELYVKNLQKLPDRLTIWSTNQNYKSFDVYPETQGIDIVAQVIWIARNIAG